MPTQISSRVSPLLSAIAYPLGTHVVVPSYFGAIEIEGQANIPRTGPVILAPTHRSRWDALMVPYGTGRNVTGRYLRFMVSADEMQGLQGWVIRRLGCFPVNTRRVNPASLQHGIELLCRGEMLVIFPEGNIYQQPEVACLKRGLAKMALQAQAQCDETIHIIPISLSYSQPVPRRGCAVRMQIGEAIAVASYQDEPIKQSSRQLTQDLFTQLSQIHDTARLPQVMA